VVRRVKDSVLVLAKKAGKVETQATMMAMLISTMLQSCQEPFEERGLSSWLRSPQRFP